MTKFVAETVVDAEYVTYNEGVSTSTPTGKQTGRAVRFDLCASLLLRLANAEQVERERLSHFFLERFANTPEQFAQFLRHVELRLPSKDGRILAKQYLGILSPLAEHFGMFKFKRRLDTACFALAFPTEYAEVQRYLQRYEHDSSTTLRRIANLLKNALRPRPCIIRGRFKEPYSVYKKFREKEYRSLASMHDLFAFRIILASGNERDCFGVLHSLHDKFMPVAGRFKDYVSIPKPNGYQSLHTTLKQVLPDLDVPVELQIRTQFMHDFSQVGLSTHWLYKKKDGPVLSREQRALLEHVASLSKFAGRQRHVYVFAEGQFLRLPVGTTVRTVARTFGKGVLDDTEPRVNQQRRDWDYAVADGDTVTFLRTGNPRAKVAARKR